MHSVSDLTTFSKKTSGDVPPKLVGASTTVVGDKVYLYGGRLVTERRMVTDMYIFDLKALNWEKIVAPPDDHTPAQRYFHSADSWKGYLIIFGGMGLKPDADESSEDLCVLNDICFYDIAANSWMPSSWSLRENPQIPPPKPRYAHLSSISGDRLFIIGGQDLDSVWLDDVYVFDLGSMTWVLQRDYPRHCGTYRSVAVSADLRVRLPQEEANASSAGAGRPLFHAGSSPSSTPTAPTSPDSFIHLPYSTQPTDDFPNDIFLYSNYNFTDVKRELEVLTPLPDSEFSVRDASASMNGPAFPPGLRFPTGAILGSHLIIAGTYLAHSFQSFSVWALNLVDMSWSRIDPGSTLATGSWFRSGLWANASKFIVFGNRQGNLVDDYNRRLLSWDHIAMIDLEAFGIYQPPRLELDPPMQEMGLAALEEGILADFEIVCDDDRKVKCSRKLLEDRWPWFKEQRRLFLQAATRALDTLPLSATHVALPDIPNTTAEPRPDPRLAPRLLNLSEPYPITLALVQYFYSLALITPLQHAPPVLSALLVLGTNYELQHLKDLVKHAMHRALSNSTSVGVYEVATLCSCRSLQIRALKTVMLYNQKRPAGRSRQDRDGGPGRSSDTNGNSGGGSAGDAPPTARPRGMSDAPMRPNDPRQLSGGIMRGHMAMAGKDSPDSDSVPRVSAPASAPRSAPRPLRRKTYSPGGSAANLPSIMDEELAVVAALHAPAIRNDLPAPADAGDEALDDDLDPRLAAHPPTITQKQEERSRLRLDTRGVARSASRSSTTTATISATPDSDGDGAWAAPRRTLRSAASLPSFHLPSRARGGTGTTYRSDTSDTPYTPSLASSASRSSLASRSSALHTPPHSPGVALTAIREVDAARGAARRLSLSSADSDDGLLGPALLRFKGKEKAAAESRPDSPHGTRTPRSAPRTLDARGSGARSPASGTTTAPAAAPAPLLLAPGVAPGLLRASSYGATPSGGALGLHVGWPFSSRKAKGSKAPPRVEEKEKRRKKETGVERAAAEMRRWAAV